MDYDDRALLELSEFDSLDDFGDKTSSLRWRSPLGLDIELYDYDDFSDRNIRLRGTGRTEAISSLDSQAVVVGLVEHFDPVKSEGEALDFGDKTSSLRWVGEEPVLPAPTLLWDLDGDDLFGEVGGAALHGDENGATPVFDASGIEAPAQVIVKVRAQIGLRGRLGGHGQHPRAGTGPGDAARSGAGAAAGTRAVASERGAIALNSTTESVRVRYASPPATCALDAAGWRTRSEQAGWRARPYPRAHSTFQEHSMPRFLAVYTMKPEDLGAFRARPKAEQEAIDEVGLKAWADWDKRNAAAIVATDVMVGKTTGVTRSGIADAQNQIAGFVIVEAPHIAAAARLFEDHPHITVFPGDGIDVMPVVSGPPEESQT